MSILENIKIPADLRKLDRSKLPQVCREVRDKILNVVSRKGGHLGASLGATEITVALHYVFNTPKDKLLWDTGHQTYGHKVLTGRQDRLETIRQYGGISGFLKRDESEYDVFGAGHASTAISAACGVAAARDIKKEDFKVVAVVSDGCITGGMSYEGLQNAGHLGTDMLVVLNDNQMFISHRVGAMGTFLAKILTLGVVTKWEKRLEKFLTRIHFWGAALVRLGKRLRVLLFPGILFEEMGFAYYGPVDGHDVVRLTEVMEAIKNTKGPALLHVITKKGKGYEHAEKDEFGWHAPGKFDVTTGELAKVPPPSAPSYTKVFGQTLVRLAKQDPKIVAITGAMPEGTGTDQMRDTFKDRYFDVGLAEEHAVTFAAGLATEGMKPVVAIYSSFMQRAYDQMEHDVALQKLPVVFAMDRGGLVGDDGPTHHGVFDYSFVRMIPRFVVMAPKDENELQHMLNTAVKYDGPISLRYPRGNGYGVAMDENLKEIPIGKAEVLKQKDGDKIAILAIGSTVYPAMEAATLLEKDGLSVTVVNMRFVKPIDADLLKDLMAKGVKKFVTVEENILACGFGSAVMEAMEGQTIAIHRIGIDDHFVEHGTQPILRDQEGLSAEKIAATVKKHAQLVVA